MMVVLWYWVVVIHDLKLHFNAKRQKMRKNEQQLMFDSIVATANKKWKFAFFI